jgi:hypothetical protein
LRVQRPNLNPRESLGAAVIAAIRRITAEPAPDDLRRLLSDLSGHCLGCTFSKQINRDRRTDIGLGDPITHGSGIPYFMAVDLLNDISSDNTSFLSR